MNQSAWRFFLFLLLGPLLVMCAADDSREFGDPNPSADDDSEETETPVPFDNFVDGSVDGYDFGAITTAYVIVVYKSCSGEPVPVIWLGDYSVTCGDLKALANGYAIEVESEGVEFNVLQMLLLTYDQNANQLEAALEAADFQVFSADNYDASWFEDNQYISLGSLHFESVGVYDADYYPEDGLVEVKLLYPPDGIAGRFQLDFGEKGELSGEFNARLCN